MGTVGLFRDRSGGFFHESRSESVAVGELVPGVRDRRAPSFSIDAYLLLPHFRRPWRHLNVSTHRQPYHIRAFWSRSVNRGIDRGHFDELDDARLADVRDSHADADPSRVADLFVADALCRRVAICNAIRNCVIVAFGDS
jgi:hypothetical protein